MSKKYLVTGSAGFIGSHLTTRLLSEGIEVIGVDNFNDFYDPSIKRDNAALNLSNDKHKLYEGDLRDYAFLEDMFAQEAATGTPITKIIHLAAYAGVRPSTQNPILYSDVNNGSTINLLELAQKNKVEKFVFASSSSVYGSRSTVPFSEGEDISKPISPYAATKVAGEAMVHAMYNIHKIPSVCLRFFTVYGPGQRPDLAIHKFAKLIANGDKIQVYGDGSALRDYTYIDDIIDGVTKSIDLDCGYEIFNLGESHTTDVKTLISLLEEKLGIKANIEFTDPIPGDVPITYADITKSKEVLAYNPQTLISEGLDKFVAWFKEKYNA